MTGSQFLAKGPEDSVGQESVNGDFRFFRGAGRLVAIGTESHLEVVVAELSGCNKIAGGMRFFFVAVGGDDVGMDG